MLPTRWLADSIVQEACHLLRRENGQRRAHEFLAFNQIAILPALSKAELLAIWAKNFSQAPPASLRKDLIVGSRPTNAQEREYGGLSKPARKTLREIAKSIEPGKQARV